MTHAYQLKQINISKEQSTCIDARKQEWAPAHQDSVSIAQYTPSIIIIIIICLGHFTQSQCPYNT